MKKLIDKIAINKHSKIYNNLVKENPEINELSLKHNCDFLDFNKNPFNNNIKKFR